MYYNIQHQMSSRWKCEWVRCKRQYNYYVFINRWAHISANVWMRMCAKSSDEWVHECNMHIVANVLHDLDSFTLNLFGNGLWLPPFRTDRSSNILLDHTRHRRRPNQSLGQWARPLGLCRPENSVSQIHSKGTISRQVEAPSDFRCLLEYAPHGA